MRLLVSGATKTLREISSPYLGALYTPAQGNAPAAIAELTDLWASDNSCFSNWSRKAQRNYHRLVDCFTCEHVSSYPEFVVCPDVVADHQATRDRWTDWISFLLSEIPTDYISEETQPVRFAFVLQDGCQSLADVPRYPPDKYSWADLDAWRLPGCLFIGGSTEYKLGPEVRRIVREYREALSDSWVHMGRVNSLKRLRYAFEIGCDSVDGTKYSRFPKVHLPRAIAFLEEIHAAAIAA